MAYLHLVLQYIFQVDWDFKTVHIITLIITVTLLKGINLFPDDKF